MAHDAPARTTGASAVLDATAVILAGFIALVVMIQHSALQPSLCIAPPDHPQLQQTVRQPQPITDPVLKDMLLHD